MFGLTWIPIDDDEEEEDTQENNSDMEEESDYSEEQNNLGHQRFRGQYCVLCSKLDINYIYVYFARTYTWKIHPRVAKYNEKATYPSDF
ncbi:LRR receptor serine/threonine-protein kinase FLS2 [Spatholobus suberectus]|nr:LRR receptor serine/threonine-protein kinase FLS2 [Spatholobus suberectus]